MGSSKAKALRILKSLPLWICIPGRYACPGWEWVPFIVIAWGRMLAGYFIHVHGEYHGGYFCLQREGNKQHEEKGERAHAYIYERMYMLIFSLEFPASGLGFPEHTRASLSVTHRNRVCPVSVHRVCLCARAFFNHGSICLPITSVISRPPIKQDLG